MTSSHRSPAVDRAAEILTLLEGSRDGLDINEISDQCGVPRSTVYRILNSLQAHSIVTRNNRTGRYTLGPRLVRLAAQVRSGLGRHELLAIARRHLELLAARTGQASKLSVFDSDLVLSLDTVAGRGEVAVTPHVGSHFPLHAGAASKVLFAALDPDRRAALLAKPLEAFTKATVTDRDKLERELGRVSAQGWALDRGEHNPNIHAVAAPVRNSDGEVVAAISLLYLGLLHPSEGTRFREATIQAADAISGELAELPRATGADRPSPAPSASH